MNESEMSAGTTVMMVLNTIDSWENLAYHGAPDPDPKKSWTENRDAMSRFVGRKLHPEETTMLSIWMAWGPTPLLDPYPGLKEKLFAEIKGKKSEEEENEFVPQWANYWSTIVERWIKVSKIG